MSALGPVPEPEVLIRKIRAKHHGGGHGGAWKVAYADFVTAMMAFFLLMWLLGATDERQRRGIADYFSPTVMQIDKSGGGDGILAGRSLEEPEGVNRNPRRSIIDPIIPYQTSGLTPTKGKAGSAELKRVEEEIRERLQRDPGLNSLQGQIRFTETPEGLRIELIDKADYSMFTTGTASMDPKASKLLSVVADVIRDMPNRLAIRGHTDSVPYQSPSGANNWTLSTERAEATRRVLAQSGVSEQRFSRLEGVADTDPLIPENGLDPRNRRMSVTLLRQ